jgi:hypothetical protein
MGVDVIVTVGRPIILCPSCRRQQEYDSEGCGLPHRDESIVFLQPRVDEVTPIVRFHRARIFEKRGRSGRITRYSEKASHDIKQYRQHLSERRHCTAAEYPPTVGWQRESAGGLEAPFSELPTIRPLWRMRHFRG